MGGSNEEFITFVFHVLGSTRCELLGCRAIVRSIAWSPHNDWQLAAGSSDGTVRVFDVTTGKGKKEGCLLVSSWSVMTIYKNFHCLLYMYYYIHERERE